MRVLAVLACLIAPVLALLGWGLLPGPGTGKPVLIEWRAGASNSEAARTFEVHGLVRSPRLFCIYLWLVGGVAAFEAGTHLLNDALTPRALVQRMARGRTRPDVSVTVPEGWNHFQIAKRMQNKGVCGERAFRSACSAPKLLRELGIDGSSTEGFLFPATYRLKVNSNPAAVIRTMVGEMRRRLSRLDEKHRGALKRLREELGWGQREVLTMASIIEKEARHHTERATVASVYYNRLTDPEFTPLRRLQADPTAGYGCLIEPGRAPSCADYRGRVTPAMLRDPANRYNTYLHQGLPPGPIANPGAQSIEAALAPADTDYLFFVAHRDGWHAFSRTLEEHNRAIGGARSRGIREEARPAH